ncbi:PAS domain-containing sensor histidine kinase [Desulfovibrio ferrophilus]|uniref:histidine kinase n=1 Tax=Desulfovibrio ferrophilus TaxID=241368 RepID=A0A2Z6B1Y3_9BACT|nr:ATP-binding protein [Desulfovibrio ferrophilus]BBD09512.1 PAS/PAC sensor signal transduction histidine kinase [Desulfovibrio ferrophilus]
MNYGNRQWVIPALKSASIYALVGGLWILLSDKALDLLVTNHDTYTMLQTWKGWFYVLVTALLVFALLSKYLKQSFDQKESIRLSQERLAFALGAVRDGVWDWDLTTDEVYFSPGYTAMLGYEDNAGFTNINSWQDNMHPDDREHSLEVSKDCIEGRIGHFAMEFRMRTKDGGWCWILGRGKVVAHDHTGRALRMVGTHTNITHQKRVEHELRTLRNSMENIINSMPSVIIGTDRDMQITQWNRSAEMLTGAPAKLALGYRLTDILHLPEELTDSITQAVTHGEALELTQQNLLGDASRIANIFVFPLKNEGITGAVIRIDDVTEQVQMQQIIVQTEKMISLGGLAAGMAHELNNPLSGILQSVQNIQRRSAEDLPANQNAAQNVGLDLKAMHDYFRDRDINRFLDGIQSSGQRAAGIINNLLAFSRSSDSSLAPCSVPDLLDNAIALAESDYNLAKQYDFKAVHIHREYEPNLPAITVTAQEIEQVFLNLLKNSAMAMAGEPTPDKEPTITLRTSSDGPMVRIEIEDNGPGFPDGVSKRLFEPFFTTKPPGEGTGLGLSVSYFIITQNHQGQITAETAPGGGARFTILLPQAKPGPQGVAAQRE